MSIISTIKNKIAERRRLETNPEYRRAVLKYETEKAREEITKQRELEQLKKLKRENSFIYRTQQQLKEMKKNRELSQRTITSGKKKKFKGTKKVYVSNPFESSGNNVIYGESKSVFAPPKNKRIF